MRENSGNAVLVRCDGSPAIGMGHVMRCLSLAQALRSIGCQVEFALQPLPGAAPASVQQAGFRLTELVPTQGGLGTSEAQRLCDIASARGIACVLVDHYGAGAEYYAVLAGAGLRVAAIDDTAEGDFGTAGWLLNQNLPAPELSFRMAPGCKLLLGPRFALLRPEFALARQSLNRSFTAAGSRVLVTLGGGDAGEVAQEILCALGRMPVHVRFVAGSTAVNDLPANVEMLHAVRDMAEQMCWADVSVNAGGSTCWELCCLGVPMVVLALAENQKGNARSLGRRGCAVDVGDARAGIGAQVAEAVERLLAQPAACERMSATGMALVDGCGAQRAAESLQEFVAE